jgi:HSP20 family protein
MTLASLVRQPQPGRRVVRRDFDKLVDDLWGGFGLAPVAFAPSHPNFPNDAFRPTFEAVELEDEYRVTADLPGVEPGDIEVTVEDGVLSIKGQRHYESETETEEGGVTRVDERGRFERRMRFPGEIAEADVKATCKHGVLTVSIPKPEDVKPEIKAIPVETV